MGAITPDEAAMDALGDEMATANGWTSELGYETLCDITGATEDWNYFSQGTYGYTPEIRGTNFHGNYADMVVDEYRRRAPARRPRGLPDRRRARRRPGPPAVIEGTAPPGATLRLHKAFATPTCEDSACAQGDGRRSDRHARDAAHRAPPTAPTSGTSTPSGRPLLPARPGR